MEVQAAKLLQQMCNVYAEIFIDTYRDRIVERILFCFFFLLKIVDGYGMLHWIYNPVFPDARRAVFKKLEALIDLLGRRGDNFYDPVRSAAAAFVGQL